MYSARVDEPVTSMADANLTTSSIDPSSAGISTDGVLFGRHGSFLVHVY